MSELLAQEVAERPAVALRRAGDSEAVVGHLRAVGADVVTVELAGPRRALAYVSLTSLTEVSFLPSG